MSLRFPLSPQSSPLDFPITSYVFEESFRYRQSKNQWTQHFSNYSYQPGVEAYEIFNDNFSSLKNCNTASNFYFQLTYIYIISIYVIE